VHLVDNHGRAMDAEYHVEADGGHLALIMEAAAACLAHRRRGTLTTTVP
jgi:hypothetical protein